ncbi:hypothetical protein PULV_a3678 [Pseudoalteromonas ulvae UL12]|uniref:DUF4124 domain-containing protein n=1 Tax=Pseudoalteromonas ulvae TaxID=107327 RepID=UPI00186BA30D|nr:DUF4124 domain-containing protein [Pseudoalteromonas ulvae]MBE0362004.1 hypothetical protein [Pseudoalteromonas ulvae UL12]
MSRATGVVMCVLMASLGISGQVTAGDIFKWTDEKGVVHFSDRPHDSKAVKVELKVANVSKSNSTESLGLSDVSQATKSPAGAETVSQQCQSIQQKMTQLAQNKQAEFDSVKTLFNEQLKKKLKELGC